MQVTCNSEAIWSFYYCHEILSLYLSSNWLSLKQLKAFSPSTFSLKNTSQDRNKPLSLKHVPLVFFKYARDESQMVRQWMKSWLKGLVKLTIRKSGHVTKMWSIWKSRMKFSVSLPEIVLLTDGNIFTNWKLTQANGAKSNSLVFYIITKNSFHVPGTVHDTQLGSGWYSC